MMIEYDQADQVTIALDVSLNSESLTGESGRFNTVGTEITPSNRNRLPCKPANSAPGTPEIPIELSKNVGANEKNYQNLNLVSLNCKNIEANYIYTEYLLEKADILFLQETWLRTNETPSFLDKNKYAVFGHSSMNNEQREDGRPFGGLMWILKKSAQIKIKVTFVTDRISTAELNGLLLIGVYMRFNDGYLETIVEQENDTLKIQELIEKNANKQVIVLGDFNSDMWRVNKFDEVVANMIEKSNLVCLDLLFTQKINYTYKLGRGKSWVDHALVNQLLAERVVSVNILNEVEDQINTSDHRAMEVVIERFRQNKQMIVKRAKQIKLDWECLEVQEEYERNVNDD
jgi:exonuclease III